VAQSASLVAQTLYAELVDRCATAAFDAEFPANGSFVRVTVRDRHYWYFQSGARDVSGRQPRKYVGPDTAEMQERIRAHGHTKDDYRERRRLVAMLRRSGFFGPPGEVGRVLQTLAAGGIFRRRACLVGTAAYQAYGPMLGGRLPNSALQTLDLDIAQFSAISIAIAKDEQPRPLLEILKGADPSFRSVPHITAQDAAVAYVNGAGLRVDVLSENRGPDRDAPVALPALGTHAQPLRFLDFLIREEVIAVILYDSGILVNVPAPARYALQKLIVAQRRPTGSAKIDKDILQAQSLLDVLAIQRPADLREAWAEASGRGRTWRSLLVDGLARLPRKVRDRALQAVGERRSIVPGADLRFIDEPPRYDPVTATVYFDGREGSERVVCAISREALDDHFDAEALAGADREAFQRNRTEIRELARLAYLYEPVSPDGPVLITSAIVPALRRSLARDPSESTSRRG
jgi:hypothetical protein